MESRDKASFFPPTIAYQLTRSRISCRTFIDKTIAQDPYVLNTHFPSQFRQLLLLSAKHLDPLEHPITIAIDGLDECASTSDQVELLNLILEAVETKRMRFLIASRPEQHIQAFFHQWDASQHTWHIRLDEETFKTSQDIKVVLRNEFARIRQARPETCLPLPNGEEWPGESIIDHLTAKSDSQFIVPTIIIHFIDNPLFPPDKQLNILLKDPPSHVFSTLDALYHTILSYQPPAERLQGEDGLREYREVVMGILRVIIAWPGDPLSAAMIAAVLDKPVQVVQNIVRGPMRALFEFHTPNHDSVIVLCHKSLRDYLLDKRRSEEFFIESTEEDAVFLAILSRPPPSHSPHSSFPNIVMDVLAAVMAAFTGRGYTEWDVPQIADFLGVDSIAVEHVVNLGPTNVLLSEEDGLRASGLEDFLRNPARSGSFFLSYRRIDTLFIQTLSRHATSDPLHSCSRNDLLDIMAMTAPGQLEGEERATIWQIAALLEVDSGLVEDVVKFGGAKSVFSVDKDGKVAFSTVWITKFLGDPDRSGGFFVSQQRLDPFYIRILSQETHSGFSNSPS